MRSDFDQLDMMLECLDFAWSATIATHELICPAPLELEARVLMPNSERGHMEAACANQMGNGNRLVSIWYI